MRLSVYYNEKLDSFGLASSNISVYLGRVYVGPSIFKVYEKTKDWKFVGYL